jgi:hypothetical protein
VAQPAHASWHGARARPAWSPSGGHAHGGAAGQGSPTAPVQCGRRREHEDGEGRSLGKRHGGAAHQGGRAMTRWRMGVAR